MANNQAKTQTNVKRVLIEQTKVQKLAQPAKGGSPKKQKRKETRRIAYWATKGAKKFVQPAKWYSKNMQKRTEMLKECL